MASRLGEPHDDGQTPLDPDEAEGLLVPLASQRALNQAEAGNVLAGIRWGSRRPLSVSDVVDEDFLRALHRRLFGEVWRWAGEYRRSDKNLGVTWVEIPIHIRRLLADTQEWLASGMGHDEAAVTFGYRLVCVHPFANGNGRHSRLASDCLARALGQPVFSWRGGGVGPPGQIRANYIAALRTADAGDTRALVSFARS